ncbi:MAG TPA: hypothetical protein VD905_16280 [Flavobacteriales bacterium]|nr:hypothetical protein [Flavobacteriales bacterium]
MKTTAFVNSFFKLAMGISAIVVSVALFNLSTKTASAASETGTLLDTREALGDDSFVGIGMQDDKAYFLQVSNGRAELRYINRAFGSSY